MRRVYLHFNFFVFLYYFFFVYYTFNSDNFYNNTNPYLYSLYLFDMYLAIPHFLIYFISTLHSVVIVQSLLGYRLTCIHSYSSVSAHDEACTPEINRPPAFRIRLPLPHTSGVLRSIFLFLFLTYWYALILQEIFRTERWFCFVWTESLIHSILFPLACYKGWHPQTQ